jgi:hypothetical protein
VTLWLKDYCYRKNNGSLGFDVDELAAYISRDVLGIDIHSKRTFFNVGLMRIISESGDDDVFRTLEESKRWDPSDALRFLKVMMPYEWEIFPKEIWLVIFSYIPDNGLYDRHLLNPFTGTTLADRARSCRCLIFNRIVHKYSGILAMTKSKPLSKEWFKCDPSLGPTAVHTDNFVSLLEVLAELEEICGFVTISDFTMKYFILALYFRYDVCDIPGERVELFKTHILPNFTLVKGSQARFFVSTNYFETNEEVLKQIADQDDKYANVLYWHTYDNPLRGEGIFVYNVSTVMEYFRVNRRALCDDMFKYWNALEQIVTLRLDVPKSLFIRLLLSKKSMYKGKTTVPIGCYIYNLCEFDALPFNARGSRVSYVDRKYNDRGEQISERMVRLPYKESTPMKLFAKKMNDVLLFISHCIAIKLQVPQKFVILCLFRNVHYSNTVVGLLRRDSYGIQPITPTTADINSYSRIVKMKNRELLYHEEFKDYCNILWSKLDTVGPWDLNMGVKLYFD